MLLTDIAARNATLGDRSYKLADVCRMALPTHASKWSLVLTVDCRYGGWRKKQKAA